MVYPYDAAPVKPDETMRANASAHACQAGHASACGQGIPRDQLFRCRARQEQRRSAHALRIGLLAPSAPAGSCFGDRVVLQAAIDRKSVV